MKLHGFRELDDFQDNPVPVGGVVGFDGFICERGDALDPHLSRLELTGGDLHGEPALGVVEVVLGFSVVLLYKGGPRFYVVDEPEKNNALIPGFGFINRVTTS